MSSKLNLSIFLSTYSDKRASNSPSLSNFKWDRAINGIAAENPISQSVTLAPSETRTLFSGSAIKKLIYLETDMPITYKINAEAVAEDLKPIVINDSSFPGVLLRTSDITSLEVTNPSATEEVTIFLAAVE